MWECGLKHRGILGWMFWWRVTPYVGVWIETKGIKLDRNPDHVTPYVGVWIETIFTQWCWSVWRVTPYVGVWIETGLKYLTLKRLLSHSLCGSVDWNPWTYADCCQAEESLLMWECGLKRERDKDCFHDACHSLCGSVDWNNHLSSFSLHTSSHSLCGSVDWNP